MAILEVVHEAGKFRDNAALHDVINYCCQLTKTESGYVGGIAVNPLYATTEMETLASVYRNYDGVRLRHMVLSFKRAEVSSPYTAFEIARGVAEFYGSSYQIIFAVHEDTDEIHIHFVMNTVNYCTGKKYIGTKKDYYDFQKYVKEILYEYGLFLVVM